VFFGRDAALPYTRRRRAMTLAARHAANHGHWRFAMAVAGLFFKPVLTQREDTMANDTGDVIDILNDLLENSRDGEYGFRACAEEVKSPDLKDVLSRRATSCAQAASELQQLILQLGGKPADGGTASGALHRGWVHVKGAVGANSDQSMLEECERGEDAALARYRKALKAGLPPDVQAIVERQAEGAQRNHDEIKRMRDAARATHT